MTLTDATWIFTAIIFAVMVGCVVWVMKEERKVVAWYDPTNHHVSTDKRDPLFTPLGQLWPLDVKREWVGLTDDEKHDCYLKIDIWSRCVEAVEAKLKKKNT